MEYWQKKSHIRHLKNLAICGVALATRAAMDGGLHPEVAYTLSDLYIQHIEELTEIREITNIMTESLCDFADRVQKNKEQKYPRVIRICQNYIFNHLYDKITISQLAELVDMNPGYLSQLFKKEVGVPLSKYIQLEKIEEAKKLLTLTDYSLADICTLLNFNDQSYFTKVFKKFTGVTPKQFRDNNKLLTYIYPEKEGR